MKPTLALFVLVLAPGCADATLPHAFLARGFAADEITLLQEAADAWAVGTNGRHTALIVTECSDEVCSQITKLAVVPGPEGVVGRCRAELRIAGISVPDNCADNTDAARFFIDLRADAPLRKVAMHELGHVFGARHIGPGNVMGPSLVGHPDDLTPADLSTVD